MPDSHPSTPDPTRRKLLGAVGSLAVLSATLNPHNISSAYAGTTAKAEPQRALSLRNIHTLEEIEITYWENGNYLDDAILQLSHHMRDHRENETLLMDPALLDTLWQVRQNINPAMRFDIISGYRTPKTNAMLRKRSSKVAKFSYHMVGKAVDISTQQAPISALRDAGLEVGRGGVGYYPGSRFVHLDTGPVRAW